MNYNDPLIITVGQLNRYVKSLLDADENLYNLYLVGEISNFTDHYKSGHFYFSLKDEDAQIKAVMFRNNASRVRFHVENGMRVIVRGRVSMYEAAGQYQIFVDDMQPDGVGALNLAFEQLKEKLQKEGLFDAAHDSENAEARRGDNFRDRRRRAGYSQYSRPSFSARRSGFSTGARARRGRARTADCRHTGI